MVATHQRLRSSASRRALLGAAVAVATLSGSAAPVAVHAEAKKPAPQQQVKHTAQMEQSLRLNEEGAQAIKAKNFDGAEQLFRQAIEADAGNLTAVFNLAGMYLTNKKEQEAVKLLEQYAGNAKDPGLMTRLGDAYFAVKEIDKSIAAYDKALAFEPGYPGIHSKLGTLYSLKGKLKEAERMFLLAVEEDPKNPQTIANLSNIFLANGKVTEAIGAAKRGLQVKSSKELYATLGNAYLSKKDLDNALIAFERARDLGAKDPAILKEIENLKKLKAS